jgi:hypothetical protein
VAAAEMSVWPAGRAELYDVSVADDDRGSVLTRHLARGSPKFRVLKAGNIVLPVRDPRGAHWVLQPHGLAFKSGPP